MADLLAPLTPGEWSALALSLRVSLVSTLLILPVGFGLAYALARGRFVGRSLLDGLVHLPLVLPPVVTGFALLLLFGIQGPAGRFLEQTLGISVAFRWTGAAIAAAVMGLPLVVRPIRLSLETVDRRLERAAATLGAPPVWRFLTVTLPLAAPGVLAGAVLGFAKSFGEFGATITFVGAVEGETLTVPLAIYGALQVPGAETQALRLALAATAVSLGALLASNALAGRALAGRSAL